MLEKPRKMYKKAVASGAVEDKGHTNKRMTADKVGLPVVSGIGETCKKYSSRARNVVDGLVSDVKRVTTKKQMNENAVASGAVEDKGHANKRMTADNINISMVLRKEEEYKKYLKGDVTSRARGVVDGLVSGVKRVPTKKQAALNEFMRACGLYGLKMDRVGNPGLHKLRGDLSSAYSAYRNAENASEWDKFRDSVRSFRKSVPTARQEALDHFYDVYQHYMVDQADKLISHEMALFCHDHNRQKKQAHAEKDAAVDVSSKQGTNPDVVSPVLFASNSQPVRAVRAARSN